MSNSTPPPLTLEEINCPLCDVSEHRPVVESPDNQWGIQGNFSVVECVGCQHRFMNPRPTLSSLADCYPDNYGPHQLAPQPVDCATETSKPDVTATPWYLRYLPLRYIPGLRSLYFWLTNERSQVLPNPFRANPTSAETPRAFELGCAAGSYLARLRDKGWEVVGVEPGSEPVKTATTAGLDVRQGTLDDAAPDPESFDFAASWMVIEHVPDPRCTLQQLHQLLKPGGKLAISIPNAGCWEPKVFGSNWDAWDLPRHLHHFSPRSIRKLLQECEFTNIQITYQRTLLNIFGSIGIMLTHRNPDSKIGTWFLRYPHSPRLIVQLIAAPLAQVLAFFRQGGRLTITATRSIGPTNDSKTDAGNEA